MTTPGMLSHGMPPRDNDIQRMLKEHQAQINQLRSNLTGAVNGATSAVGSISAANWYMSDYAITTAGVAVISEAVTIPAGFTSGALIVTSNACATNTGGATDELNSFISIGSSASQSLSARAVSGAIATVGNSFIFSGPTGLDPSVSHPLGLVLTLDTSSSDWASTATNGAALSVLAIWQP